MARRLTILQARILLLVLGAGLSAGQTLLAWERGAAPTEVLAPALYILVFAGAIFWSLPGGAAGAGVASLLYGVLLVEQSKALGLRLFLGLLLSRIATYAFYAVVLAIGTRYLEGRLRKLELYDHIDDLTGLYNSAFFLEDSDLEISRANRYQTLFSVVDLQVGRDAFAAVNRRTYQRTLKDLGKAIGASVRKVDRAARIDDGSSDRFLIVLPETASRGARILTGRVEAATRNLLTKRGAGDNGSVAARSITFPADLDALMELRESVAVVEADRRAIQPARASA